MQDERDPDGLAQPSHQVEVQDRVPGQHGVRAAYGDRQRVDSGRRHVTRRLPGIGTGQRGVHPVLAADLPKLRLDP